MRRGFAFAFELLRLLLPSLFFGPFFPLFYFPFFVHKSVSFFNYLYPLCRRFVLAFFKKITYMAN